MKQPSKTSAVTQKILDSRSAYDQWAQSYDTHPNPTVAMARIALARDLQHVEGLSVFEFGCGTGENLYNLGCRGAASLVGADVSAGMLGRARGKLDGMDAHLHHINDMETSFLMNETFDLIMAILVLEHIENIDRFFQLASHRAAEGGVIYVSELHPVQSSMGIRAHFQDEEGIEISTHSFHRTENEFIASAERSGLRPDFIRSWTPDEEVIAAEPKTLKYKDQQLLLTMCFVK